MDLQDFIDKKLAEIANSLPETVKQPASFGCGFDTGYKHALLDVERLFCEKSNDEF